MLCDSQQISIAKSETPHAPRSKSCANDGNHPTALNCPTGSEPPREPAAPP